MAQVVHAVEYVEPNQVEKLIAVALTPRDKAFIALLARHGIRISEAIAITRHDIDFDKSALVIVHLKERSKLRCPSCRHILSKSHLYYKMALMRATALDRATRVEEKRARQKKRPIDPENIEDLAKRYLARMSYKAQGCRFHSFVVYFSTLQRLSWVEATGREELSSFQEHYPPGPPRRYFRLTEAGRGASETAWANPYLALYG